MNFQLDVQNCLLDSEEASILKFNDMIIYFKTKKSISHIYFMAIWENVAMIKP